MCLFLSRLPVTSLSAAGEATGSTVVTVAVGAHLCVFLAGLGRSSTSSSDCWCSSTSIAESRLMADRRLCNPLLLEEDVGWMFFGEIKGPARPPLHCRCPRPGRRGFAVGQFAAKTAKRSEKSRAAWSRGSLRLVLFRAGQWCWPSAAVIERCPPFHCPTFHENKVEQVGHHHVFIGVGLEVLGSGTPHCLGGEVGDVVQEGVEGQHLNAGHQDIEASDH